MYGRKPPLSADALLCTQELHGVFRAVSAGGWNIDPLAYGGKPKEGSMYPAQVRVEYCPRCPPMEEQYFKPAIAANYFNPNRFRWELNERQVSDTSVDYELTWTLLGLA